MRSRSASAVLQLPVCHHGIQLGCPVDLLLRAEPWQAVGLVVLCGDRVQRFLPFAAAQPGAADIAVGSPLMLLEDVEFYLARSIPLRALLGGSVECRGRLLGTLRDVLLAGDGAVAEFEVEHLGERVRVPAAGTVVSPARASAA